MGHSVKFLIVDFPQSLKATLFQRVSIHPGKKGPLEVVPNLSKIVIWCCPNTEDI